MSSAKVRLFTANYCGACKAVYPVIKASPHPIEVIDISDGQPQENFDLAARSGIMQLPALVAYKDESVVSRHTGLFGSAELKDILDTVGLA